MIDAETAQRIGEAIAPMWDWRPGCLVQIRIVLERAAVRVQCVEHVSGRARLSCFHDNTDITKRWGHVVDTKHDGWPDFRDAATLGQLEETVDAVYGSAGPMFAACLPFMAQWPNVWTVVEAGGSCAMLGGGTRARRRRCLRHGWTVGKGGEA